MIRDRLSSQRRVRVAAVIVMFTLVIAALSAAEPAADGAGGQALQWGRVARTMGLWALIALLSTQAVMLLWKAVLLPIARRTRTNLDVAIFKATQKPVQALAAFILLRLGSRIAVVESPALAGHEPWPVWEGILYVGTVLAGASLVYAIAHAVTDWYAEEFAAKTSSRLDDQFMVLFRKIAKFVFLFIALTIIFSHFDIQITGLLATAGVASLAVAFAAQETLANMIAGFVLMVDRPFVIGDRIQLGNGEVGDVVDIGLRSTKMLSFDNTIITVPNSDVAKSQIVNLNAPDAQVKIRQTMGVAYGTDLRRTKAILMEIMAAHPDILKTPEPAVYFTEFAESSLNLLFVCWVADYRERHRILDELNMAIKDRFEASGIQIPFPQRDVNLRVLATPNGKADDVIAHK